MTDPVLVHIENRFALLTVNDLERRNAVTAQISAALLRLSTLPRPARKNYAIFR